MSQFNLDTPINPATKSGSQLADDLSGTSKWRDALHTLHKGSSRPSYAAAGMLWVDDSAAPNWSIYLYDGTDDILFATFNTTTNVITNLIDTDSAQTLTNKIIAFDDNTLTDVASIDTAQTLTNKTIDSANNSITLDSADGDNFDFDGSETNTDITNVASVEEVNGKEIKTKVIQIGTWDMDATTLVNVTHGLTAANILTAFAFIRNDSGSVRYNLARVDAAGGSGYLTITATTIDLTRTPGGIFDNTGYDDTGINRGWVIIQYEV